jgi:hypothetical protein
MKKKRKSRKGCKNKGVSDEAKLIAELILDADGISLGNSQTKRRFDCLNASLGSGLRYARTAQFSASVSTEPKKLAPK